MRIQRRFLRETLAIWPGALAFAALVAPSPACGGGGRNATSSSSDAGADTGPTQSGADGGPDDGPALTTHLDGGPTFINGSPNPDGSNRCTGGSVGGARPVQVRTPAGYDCNTSSWPLVILLHDYASSGAEAETYFELAAQADALGFLYAHPDGTKDSSGNEFWNATNACCNVDGSSVNDSTYLSDLLGEIHSQFNSDENRIFVFGYGNGGFMAYRLACDHGTAVTAVADLGGATWADASQCPAKAPMNVLEIHGTSDVTFAYDGGTNLGAAYPSAPATIDEWSTFNHCTDGGVPGAGLDLLGDDAGTDTTVLQWPKCEWEVKLSLWSIQGGTHTPTLSPSFTPTLLSYLLAQTKP